MFRRLLARKEKFDPSSLSIRLLADARLVDPESDGEPVGWADFVGKPFLAGVYAQVCQTGEFEGTLRWLTKDNVRDWGMSDDELFELAVGNMNRLHVPQTQLNKRVFPDGAMFFFINRSSIPPSGLLLADKLWSDFGFDKKSIAAAIPNRDSLLFCNRESHSSVAQMRELNLDIWNDPETIKKYRISRDILISDHATPSGWSVADAERPL